MRLRTALTILLLVAVPVTSQAAKKKKPLTVDVTPAAIGLPLVTMTASNAPLSEVADKLGKKLGTTIDVSPAARAFRVTVALDQQPLDLTLRELAPQAYLDGVLSGGASGKTEIRAIHLRSAAEAAPSVEELAKRSSDVMMFYGNTEDAAADPFKGELEVEFRNGRLRVFARKQPLSVVVARIAEAIGIPLEIIGDPFTPIDVSVGDATLEQVMGALTPEVKLYHRRDLATLQLKPVRFVVEAPFEQPAPQQPGS